MSTADQPKNTRLEARLPESVHALLRRAAELQGRSLSDFVVSSAREAAERAIADHELIQLSLSDQQRFAGELEKPAAIAAPLQRAAEHHRKLVEPS